MNILGIETSCDETSAAVVRDGHEILSNVVSSQIELHRPYGGVVPELASRQHLALIGPVVEQALQAAGCGFSDIDAVAATFGPGLASSLLIGLNAAKGIALRLGKPFVAINHLEAHLYSPLLSEGVADALPMISLIISGGHTMLVHVRAVGEHKVLGQTLDDAAGEAFDKVAKLLGLRYPGGPEVDRVAQQGNPRAIAFPRSMLDDSSFNFSFSGLKTSVLYYLKKHPAVSVPDVCASFQEAVVDVLVGKTLRAAEQTGATVISASGGVSINRRFRQRLREECERRQWRLLLATAQLCTDNAAMIAALAYHKLRQGVQTDWSVDVAPSVGLPDSESVVQTKELD
ncbi:MAG: tRNA (adenosine(37)-N6)-threonylcarbamoyltransferase complex transferase subunit TsaD [Verrucomicrobiae bacterium]|nr:tRNA (adenosine(37)-N6)-threonylcarbamoyltransferase complex transferase subunit TsaD [Verrucomicrobiae bacterium]